MLTNRLSIVSIVSQASLLQPVESRSRRENIQFYAPMIVRNARFIFHPPAIQSILSFFPSFTVTTCAHVGLPKKEEMKHTKRVEEAKRREINTKRTDITGEICNYVDWNHRIVVVNIAHTIKVAGGTEDSKKMYVTLKQKDGEPCEGDVMSGYRLIS